jgi:uncharacterized protein (DUF1778 family)
MVRTTNDPKDTAITLRMSKTEKRLLQELARKERRGVSNYVRWFINREAGQAKQA